jgi:putative ABC transport system permease protein
MPVEAGYMLALFAVLLILVAAFNYVSLSIARSMKRAKEIGIRKVVGAHRGQLIRQFLTESVVVAVVALVLAVAFRVWLLPAFNGLSVVQCEFGSPVGIDFRRDVGPVHRLRRGGGGGGGPFFSSLGLG